jgi:hypothetical protein
MQRRTGGVEGSNACLQCDALLLNGPRIDLQRWMMSNLNVKIVLD